MPDLETALDELRRFGATHPTREPDLAKVMARARTRRLRRRGALGGALAVLIIGAVLVAVDRGPDEPAGLVTVDDPPAEGREAQPAPLPEGSLISGQAGIAQVAPQSLTLVHDQPAHLAFNLGEDLVVAQAAEVHDGAYPPQPTGPLLVLDGDGIAERPPRPGEALRLHDAGWIAGAPTALVTVRRGTTPDDTEEELLLVDVRSGERRSLGVVGGWESGLSQARLAGSHVVTLLHFGDQSLVIVRALDGHVEWELPESIVHAQVSFAVDGEQVTLLQPHFEEGSLWPVLDVRRYDLASGTPGSTSSVRLDLSPDVAVATGFCFYVEAWSGSALCDRSSGPPIQIDLATGETREVAGVDDGRVTLPRVVEEPTTGAGQGAPCPGSVIRREDGGDPQADALPPLADAATEAARAQQVLEEHRAELLEEYGAARVALGHGFGRAWAGTNGGTYATVDVDDYGIVVALGDADACPSGAALHRVLDGVPLFFLTGAEAGAPASPDATRTLYASERRAVEAFIRFAQQSNEATAAEVPFADELQLGLGPQLLVDLDARTWSNPRVWTLELEGRWAMDGPISALDLLEASPALALTRDRTASCSSDRAADPPPELAGLARLTLSPTEIDSCLHWFAIDLYLEEGGAIAGVTVELWEP